MPRIVSLQPNAVAVADLGYFAYKIDVGVTSFKNVPAFSLVYRYPPNPIGLYRPADSEWVGLAEAAVITLARVQISVAEDANALRRVTEVSLDGGSLDTDLARMHEAYQLFKNDPKIRIDKLEEAINDSDEVVKGYWLLREWMKTGMAERKEIVVKETTMVCFP